jgi:hypothetical protein
VAALKIQLVINRVQTRFGAVLIGLSPRRSRYSDATNQGTTGLDNDTPAERKGLRYKIQAEALIPASIN